jgi:aminomethyltransferase
MKTCLYDRHVALKAKMVDFSGWQMPIQYGGIVQEHLSVRNSAGLFDVSHMGRVLIEGPDAEKFLDYISTNQIAGKKNLTATYTVWCRENGTCVDDVIVYKTDANHFFVIVNASNREKDLAHLQQESKKFDVQITPLFSDAIIALQGPLSSPFLEKIIPDISQLKPMHFDFYSYKDSQIVVSATGYTGEAGFEIYAAENIITDLWDALIGAGVHPIGLGARDTLRLEKGYALYGHELSDEILASESVSAWTIKKNKPQFLGKQALEAAAKRYSYGIVLTGPGIAREGYQVYKEDKLIGRVTSGTFSPSLNKAIAIVLVDEKLELGESVLVAIRANKVEAQVVKLPF